MTQTSISLIKSVRAKIPPRMGLITWEPWVINYIGADKMDTKEWVDTYAAYHAIVVDYGVNAAMLNESFMCGRLDDLMEMYGQTTNIGDLRISKTRELTLDIFKKRMMELSKGEIGSVRAAAASSAAPPL